MASGLSSRVVPFLQSALGAMGLSLQITTSETADGLRFELEGDGGELLLRRKGEALDALQHVVNVAFRKHLAEGQRIALDYQSFRKDKDAELRKMAQFLMERAKSTGVAQEIGPLNPYARRIVHLAVAEDAQMASESIGDAFLKTVLISVRGRS